IDLTIVGPELPLVLGIVDAFEANGLKIFGPNKVAAQFEGSKDFTKSFLERHGIPNAHSETHIEYADAILALKRFDYPVVIKADGLAAGKGVVIAENEADAIQFLDEIMLKKVFGDSGSKVVIEQFLKGVEASILCFVDGETILPMSPAQDYKKAFDGDLGLNTGGMGTYSPSKMIDDVMMAAIQTKILDPFIKGIKMDGIHFKGILFVGIMIDGDEINVLEYNVRLGDPETEVTLIRMENDLIDVIEAVMNDQLHTVNLSWSDAHAVCVILASGGYPEVYEKNKQIFGIDDVRLNAFVYHFGTKREAGNFYTNGGRVLGVTATGQTLEEARASAYECVKEIHFEGMTYRSDIGKF
ncbi:MAG TPA: phosphoribosylamine--glycine ligase, partial [Clostridiales bacterium UBA8960]|nr:phosphoribosylamine--glycine ligase [Clostridiales bacterium UBA8960]